MLLLISYNDTTTTSTTTTITIAITTPHGNVGIIEASEKFIPGCTESELIRDAIRNGSSRIPQELTLIIVIFRREFDQLRVVNSPLSAVLVIIRQHNLHN